MEWRYHGSSSVVLTPGVSCMRGHHDHTNTKSGGGGSAPKKRQWEELVLPNGLGGSEVQLWFSSNPRETWSPSGPKQKFKLVQATLGPTNRIPGIMDIYAKLG